MTAARNMEDAQRKVDHVMLEDKVWMFNNKETHTERFIDASSGKHVSDEKGTKVIGLERIAEFIEDTLRDKRMNLDAQARMLVKHTYGSERQSQKDVEGQLLLWVKCKHKRENNPQADNTSPRGKWATTLMQGATIQAMASMKAGVSANLFQGIKKVTGRKIFANIENYTC